MLKMLRCSLQTIIRELFLTIKLIFKETLLIWFFGFLTSIVSVQPGYWKDIIYPFSRYRRWFYPDPKISIMMKI